VTSSSSSSPPFDLAIFDFDGTLADSADWLLSVFNSVAERYRFKQVDDAEIAMLRGRSSREAMRYLGIPMWRLPSIARYMRKLSLGAVDQIPLFDGIDNLLADLEARGVRIAIVSSNGEATVRRVLGDQNAARIAIYACGAGVFSKARKFRKVAKTAGVAPSRVACVGDEIRDVEAALQTGMTPISVTWGYATKDALALARPASIASSVESLRDALLTPAP
jgi:phosphoglycolate phosphatase